MCLLYTTIPFSSPTPLASSEAKKPGWPTTGIINSLRPSIKTSPSTKLPREESPRHLVTPSEGFTTHEAQGGKQTDNSNSSLPSIVTGRTYELSSGRAIEGAFKSETQIETQNPTILTPDTLR